jgi:hypothetical protein
MKEFQLLNKLLSIDFNDAIGNPNLAFMIYIYITLNLAYVHDLLFSLLSGKDKDLDVFFEEHLPNSFKDTIKLTTMNPKAQAIFAHILVDATFIYLICVNKKPNETNF